MRLFLEHLSSAKATQSDTSKAISWFRVQFSSSKAVQPLSFSSVRLLMEQSRASNAGQEERLSVTSLFSLQSMVFKAVQPASFRSAS